MQVFLYYCTPVEIIFDNEFKIQMTDNMDNVLAKIHWAFGEYRFTTADVISTETGEVILTAREDQGEKINDNYLQSGRWYRIY